jgi:uncharacterized protein
VIYLDSSAIVKLLIEENETPSLRAWIGDQPFAVTSALASVEVRRTVRVFATTGGRARGTTTEHVRARAEALFAEIVVLALDAAVIEHAATLDPPRMRTLDALHLASALSLDDLDVFVTYDRRLGDAARLAGLKVASPGAE